jgi:hypothetical protein
MIHTRRVKLPFKIEEGQQTGWWVFAGISRWVQFLNQSFHLAKGNVETTSQEKKTHQQPPARYLLEAHHDSLVGKLQLSW